MPFKPEMYIIKVQSKLVCWRELTEKQEWSLFWPIFQTNSLQFWISYWYQSSIIGDRSIFLTELVNIKNTTPHDIKLVFCLENLWTGQLLHYTKTNYFHKYAQHKKNKN